MARDRMVRVGRLLRAVLSEKVLAIARDAQLGVVSVTDVQPASDLSVAKVYVSVLGDEAHRERVLALLEERAGELRFLLGREVRLRRIPQLLFVSDYSIERGVRIVSLIESLSPEGGEPGAPDSEPEPSGGKREEDERVDGSEGD